MMRRLLFVGLCVCSFLFSVLTFQTFAAEQGAFDSIVLDFRDDLSAAQLDRELGEIKSTYNAAAQFNSKFSEADHVFILKGDRTTLRKLQNSELKKYTEFIEPNYIYKTTATPNDPDYEKQWNFKTINVEEAWKHSKGKGTIVAVIDTGISQVLDLKQTKFVEGYDFVNDRSEAIDDNGHGTHVAGTIAQSTNNGIGVAGIAYQASLMPLKVLSARGGGTTADIAEAIRWAADNGANVINMSLGGGGDSKLMREAIDYAHSKDVTIVAAAGNANRSTAEYPALYPHVIAVSAYDALQAKTFYSNYGGGVDIAAPGGSYVLYAQLPGGILQNTIAPDSGESVFKYLQGTSMASPHVAGVAALIHSIGVHKPDQIEQVLKKSAIPVKDDPQNFFGAGKLDAKGAVTLALKERSFFWWFSPKLWSGFLGTRIWFDGAAFNLGLKLLMFGVAVGLAFVFCNPSQGGGSLFWGLLFGSCGLFFFRGIFVANLPQFPLRLLGSSIPELVGTLLNSDALNPISASVLIPFLLLAIFLGHPSLKWFAIGSGFGVAACLAVSAVVAPEMQWFGTSIVARSYLGVNALLALGLAMLAVRE
ncbi:S8 family serine peptidase [Leptolyngbya sp. AN03gr2]|uniref:S8 family serine peptidase n=1 Tax=unclassified Leptolyngbya TaxID=2650499 RepID=UPI003D31B004